MELENLDVDWTFPEADTQYATHGFHKYPARMPPQIPDTVLSHLKDEGVLNSDSVVYDPFSGSGTTMVEARLNNLNAMGNDINPFACLLSTAKATRVDPDEVRGAWNEYRESMQNSIKVVAEEYSEDEDAVSVEEPGVRDGWFPQPQLYQLGAIRDVISEIDSDYGEDVSRIFRVALAETAREISYQRNGEFKRYRMAEEDRDEHDPDVWEEFVDSIEDKIPRVEEFYNEASSDDETNIFSADSRDVNEIDDDSVDVIITSPPYGDHKTTVAYGEFSQDPGIISNEFEYDVMRKVDKRGLGGKNNYESLQELEGVSESLSQTIDTLDEKDGRKEDAVNFFEDYYQVMKECHRVLKPGQPIIWVVANRTMSRVNIPTHLITKELCEDIGLEFVTNIPREIPRRTMPLKNAPENVPGLDGELMSDENILVMKKSE